MKYQDKIFMNHQELLKEILAPRNRGERVVFTNGCFDLIHPGHTRYLADAKALGDRLVVAINSDSSVKKIKGKGRPIQPEGARVEIMAALSVVDWVTLFNEDTPFELIQLLSPDVLVKGGDWPVEKIVGADVVQAAGGEVKSIPITYKGSTSQIIESILKSS
ncbi:D-glycero-beta-D-manno-heptose 1-phosphate adenylyltransferase [Bdellovibrionota bacterium]